MYKKIIKLFAVFVSILFVGNIDVYAFETNLDYGVGCYYKNGYSIEIFSSSRTFENIQFVGTEKDVNLPAYIETSMPEGDFVYNNPNIISWLQKLGFVDSKGDFTCPSKLVDLNPDDNDEPQYNLSDIDLGPLNEKVCGHNNCHYADIKDDFKNWTCNYKSSIGNKTMSIKYIEDTEYIHGRYIITYPDGTTNYLANPNGSGKFYSENGHEYINSNGNLLETDGTCDDVYYVKSTKKISTSLGESGATNNVTLSGLCDKYQTGDIVHFCNNGVCQMDDMRCPDNSRANDILNNTMFKVIKFVKRVVFNTLQIFVPILLIILGSIDLGKAVMSGDDRATKEAVSRFARRCITAVLVFFVVTFVSVVIGWLSKSGVSDTTTWKDYWRMS